MLERHATVRSKSGLHARPAARFTKAAAECGHEVLISKPGGRSVTAASLLMVMTLGLNCGDEVVLTSNDPDAAEALDRLAVLVETDLDAA